MAGEGGLGREFQVLGVGVSSVRESEGDLDWAPVVAAPPPHGMVTTSEQSEYIKFLEQCLAWSNALPEDIHTKEVQTIFH